jgi:hypothetical protein
VTVTCAKYSNLNDKKAPKHPFAANPLTYIAYEDRLLKAREVAIRVYAFRAIRETYLIANR